MNLYLIRHGLAAERGTYANDEARPLTEEGQRKTRQVAKRFLQLGLRFDRLLTSPLVRAEQTAEILVKVGLSDRAEELSCLAPDGDIQDCLGWLRSQSLASDASVALVGHEPDLSYWAEQLVWGEARGQLILKKAGAIGVSIPNLTDPIAQASLFWLAPPRLIL